MEGDTSTDHIESKAIIAKVLYAYFQSEDALREGCTGIDSLPKFTTVRMPAKLVAIHACPSQVCLSSHGYMPTQAIAANFLVEPALNARKEFYDACGLPPPDESGGSLTSRIGRAN
jgi:hypothetical protein